MMVGDVRQLAAEAGGQGQTGRPDSDPDDSGVIDHRTARPGRQRRDGGGRDHEHDQADRDAEPERPSPAEVIGDEAAEQRTRHGRDTEYRPERTLVPPAVSQWDHLGDEGRGGHHDRAATDALQGSRGHQHDHRTGQAAEDRSDEKTQDRGLVHDFAAEDVADLPDHRGDDRGGEQVARHHPRLMAGAAEIRHHRRERGGDDGLVERGQQHAEQNGDEHQVASAHAQQRRARGLLGGG